MRGPVWRATLALPLCLLIACGCESSGDKSRNAKDTIRGVPMPASSAVHGPPIVVGTTLDGATGERLAGALVRGPDGSEVVSDAEGRFVLEGMPLGTAGPLEATAEGGLVGRNQLQPLGGGRLEVVLRLYRED